MLYSDIPSCIFGMFLTSEIKMKSKIKLIISLMNFILVEEY